LRILRSFAVFGDCHFYAFMSDVGRRATAALAVQLGFAIAVVACAAAGLFRPVRVGTGAPRA